MPARSNIFQRLVFELHRDLGPGWHVSESRELTDSITGEPREVDVVAEAVVGGYPLLLCIEVRDRKRPSDVTWLECVAKKHDHLPTNKLVLWSSSGFSASTLTKAKALGIEAVTPGSADNAPWATIARRLIGSSLKFVRPKLEAFVDVILGNGSIELWKANPGMLLRQEEGDMESQVDAILNQIIDNPEFRTILLDHAPEGSGNFHAIYSPPFPCTVIRPSGPRGKLTRMVIDITSVCEIAPVSARSALHHGIVTTLAEATLSDGTLQFVVHEPETGSASTKATHQWRSTTKPAGGPVARQPGRRGRKK
jgi:hypothetical protein